MTACGNPESHTGKIHHYYTCQNRKCSRFTKRLVEDTYLNYLKASKPRANLIPMLKQMATDIYKDNSRSLKVKNERLKREIDEFKEKKRKSKQWKISLTAFTAKKTGKKC
jgi:hypothetical protein